MSEFNSKAFGKASFARRETSVSFPELKDFFNEGQEPKFTVRGLSADEIYRAKHEAADRNKTTSEVMAQLNSGTPNEKASALLQSLGYDDEVPASLVIVFEHVEAALISPKLTRPEIVKLGEFFPTVLMVLENKIMALTGLGAEAQVKR